LKFKEYFYWYIFIFFNIIKYYAYYLYIRNNMEKIKKDYLSLLSSSSTEQVKLHFGKPLQPINSPKRPERFKRGLPHLEHSPTFPGV